jgi:hypothetical protein
VQRGAAILGALAPAIGLAAAPGAPAQAPPRATAALTTPPDCPRTRTVRFVVTGREIERVTFSFDGRRARRLFEPNDGTRWRYGRRTRALSVGEHRIVARVVFSERSRRPAAALRGSFRRCRPAPDARLHATSGPRYGRKDDRGEH